MSTESNTLTLEHVLLNNAVQASPKEIALSDGYRSVNWQDLRDRSVALAEIMQSELSLIADQHIALLVGNRVEFIELMLAGMIAGVWITPVNTHLQADEVSYIVKDSEAKVVFFDTAHEHLLADHGQRADLTSNSHRYINIESLAEKITQRLANAKVTDLYACFPLSGPAGGTMLYTSGTTGKPKGVKRNKPNSLGEALDRMQSGGALFGLVGTGPHIVTGPLYHAAPMLFALYDLLNGAPMVIMPKWDNLAFIQLVAQHNATTTHLVPTMCVRLLNALAEDPEQYAAHDISSLTLALHGAAPIAKTTKQKMLDWWGPILVEYWGGTEAGVTTIVTSEQWLSHPGTVGKALSHFDVFVGDKQGNEILSESDKTEGLLFCRHHQLSQVFEYHHDHSKTLKAHPQPYVFCIGDIGYVDDEGFVYLSDRESNMIISGGVNIYPAETEQILLEHEAVADVAVFGVPSEEWGELVKAAVQLKPGYDDTSELEQQMIAWVRKKIAIYKAPRSIVFEASLPRTPTGKLLVRKLKEKY